MSYLNERVAYLKGLAEGMELDSTTKEGKLLMQIVDILGEFANEIEDVYEELDDLSEAVVELDEYTEMIDEDLAAVEEDIFELDEDYEDLECPDCGETIFVEGHIIDDGGEITCPNCGLIIEFSDDCDCDDESCSCDEE